MSGVPAAAVLRNYLAQESALGRFRRHFMDWLFQRVGLETWLIYSEIIEDKLPGPQWITQR